MNCEAETRQKHVGGILFYLILVFGNLLCPFLFIVLGFVLGPSLGMLGLCWLSITTGWFLVYLTESGRPDLAPFFMFSLCYCSVFFLPLLGAFRLKNRTARKSCAAVQLLFIVCHPASTSS